MGTRGGDNTLELAPAAKGRAEDKSYSPRMWYFIKKQYKKYKCLNFHFSKHLS